MSIGVRSNVGNMNNGGMNLSPPHAGRGGAGVGGRGRGGGGVGRALVGSVPHGGGGGISIGINANSNARGNFSNGKGRSVSGIAAPRLAGGARVRPALTSFTSRNVGAASGSGGSSSGGGGAGPASASRTLSPVPQRAHNHVMITNSNGVQLLSCPVRGCSGKSYEKPGNLKRHLMEKHPGSQAAKRARAEDKSSKGQRRTAAAPRRQQQDRSLAGEIFQDSNPGEVQIRRAVFSGGKADQGLIPMDKLGSELQDARMIDKMKERREDMESPDPLDSVLDFVGDAAAQYLVECSTTAGVSIAGYRKIEKAMQLFCYSAIEKYAFSSVNDKAQLASQIRRGNHLVHSLPWSELFGAIQKFNEMGDAEHGGGQLKTMNIGLTLHFQRWCIKRCNSNSTHKWPPY